MSFDRQVLNQVKRIFNARLRRATNETNPASMKTYHKAAAMLGLLVIMPLMTGAQVITFVDLNPAGYNGSILYATTGSQQAGASYAGSLHAGIWSGTAGSFVDLNPAAASESEAMATSGSQQAGRARVGGSFHAGIWSGTAGSFMDLHPDGATSSRVRATTGSQQAG